MKRKLVLVLVVSMLAALAMTSSAFATGGGLSYTSGVQVVNLDAGTATIGLTYYNQDGTIEASPADTIPGNGSKTYFPIHAGVGFDGSLVISSDKPITAIANTITTDFAYGAATTSFSSGSTTVDLPLIMCNNSGFNTWFNVQNAGSSSASIDIDYTPGSNGVSGSESDTIAIGAAHTFDQASGSSTTNCDDLADGSGKFIGSARVTSNQPVVATVMQLGTGGFNVLMGYNGFASGGSTTVQLPLIMALNSGFYTGYQVQNVGGSSTVATIEYGTNLGGALTPLPDSCSLDPGESCTLIQNGGQWTSKYVGSASVTASQDLVVVVNQISAGGGGVGPFGTAYEGFDPSGATGAISASLIMANNGGYYTGVQVMNVGGGTCGTVTIDYGANLGGGFNPVNETFSLAAGASWTVIQNGSAPGNGGSNNWGTNKYVGSAEITGSGCTLVAIVNELAITGGDNFFTYIGFNH